MKTRTCEICGKPAKYFLLSRSFWYCREHYAAVLRDLKPKGRKKTVIAVSKRYSSVWLGIEKSEDKKTILLENAVQLAKNHSLKPKIKERQNVLLQKENFEVFKYD